VLPVIEGLRRGTDVPLSIDTRHAPVAAAAFAAGADILNDVSALTHDPDMAAAAVAARAGVVLMHMRGEPATMQDQPVYEDVLAQVAAYLEQRIRAARAAGVEAEALVVDPGIGFGKTVEHNLALLRGLPTLAGLGCPLLIGLSRKRFLGAITGRKTGERMAASLAAHTYAALQGASILRVHDVMQTCDAMAIVDKLLAGTP
jgi:dihydropteroate synthase